MWSVEWVLWMESDRMVSVECPYGLVGFVMLNVGRGMCKAKDL